MKTRGFQTMPAGYDYATDMAWWCTELFLDAAIVGAVDFGFGAADPCGTLRPVSPAGGAVPE